MPYGRATRIQLDQVHNARDAVVLIRARDNGAVRGSVHVAEWVGYHSVTSLEANLWLEGVRVLSTEHLERNIWAVEKSCVIRTVTTEAYHKVVCCRCRSIRVDIDLVASLKGSGIGAA